jgi:hypothetical protein
LQNISETYAATWKLKLAADFPPLEYLMPQESADIKNFDFNEQKCIFKHLQKG